MSGKSPVLGELIKASAVVIGAVPVCLVVTECAQVKMGRRGAHGRPADHDRGMKM